MNQDRPEREQLRAWYAESADSALMAFGSDAGNGLSDAAALESLRTHGRNLLPPPARRGPLARFLLQMHNMLIYVLLASGAGKVLLGEWVDAGVIFGVVLINSLLGFLQEGKAEKALDSIRNMLSPEATVVRNGTPRVIPAEELVPGDIVLLQSGDKVPADLRLLETKNLRVEEAALTGESVAVIKQTDPVAENSVVGDRKCMAFSGTLVVSGRGRGLVVATGKNTEIGRINQMLADVKALETPLLRQIEKFGKALTAVILIICALTFAYGVLFRGQEFVEMFKAAVGIAVAVIPEGLPAIVTITLAIGVQRMARRNAIIRRLPAVETLGSVTRICSDKTGTLTLNEMVVNRAVTSAGTWEITGHGYDPAGEVRLLGDAESSRDVLEKMALVSVLCNEAHLELRDGRWTITGDATEGALLPFAAKVGIQANDIISRFPRINSIPFESEHKFMATVHRDGEREFLLVKGAPDVIFRHSNRQEVGQSCAPVDFSADFWERQNDEIASHGNRVLALAWLPNTRLGERELSPSDLPTNLVFLGLVGIMDPPRPEAVEAVRQCHEGGIRVTMITGDHAATASAIARMLGIGDGKTCLTGRQIEEMDDDLLELKCRRVDVFARTTPEHKLRLVRAMQADGQVVAMTGDGVNDAPALRQADVGVAMGIKGTEVSKEAAEMVLADDNFASITAAVKEGRTVFNNIEKALLFMLPTNGAQGMTILAAILFGLTLPITPPQILWINMVTSITLALAISFEPHERDIMLRPPRQVMRPLLDAFGLWRIGFISLLLLLFTFGTFFYLYHVHEFPIEICRTTAINALIVGQIFYLLNSRFLLRGSITPRVFAGNKWVPLSIIGVLALQALFTYAPWMNSIFRTAPIPLHYWAWLLLGGLILFLLVEAEKFVLRTSRADRG